MTDFTTPTPDVLARTARALAAVFEILGKPKAPTADTVEAPVQRTPNETAAA